MLRITVRFPLGVYHGQAAQSAEQPEWPPSPLRLVGALLAAAHERPGAEPDLDRALIARLCEAPSPTIGAPESVAVGEPIDDAPGRGAEAVRLRGATRWAPRNYVDRALSPRNLGRERAAVSKVGVALGDRPVHFQWPELTLGLPELDRLRGLAADVVFLGTSRSPVLVEVSDVPLVEPHGAWEPVGGGQAFGSGVDVRVPDRLTIAAFDLRQDARRATSDKLQSGGMVPQIAIGRRIGYRHTRGAGEQVVDPGWWGEAIVLAVDRDRSELRPKAPAAYLLARAVRVALLGAYGEPGSAGEAPPILTGRGSEPHCAIVPLPFVWGEHADGAILGVAIVIPHARRVPDLAAQRVRVEAGLRRLIEEGRFAQIPGAGRIWLQQPDPLTARRVTLRFPRYAAESRSWVSVTPVVHSRWRKGGAAGLLRQLEADCAHVGLPAPSEVELLRGPGRPGGAFRLKGGDRMPEAWRASLTGQTEHLRLVFAEPVRGPILLGRARHFGGGLFVPVGDEPASTRAAA
ncbi:MAG TPA: type I-U CRISPR-associated protein Csb2 [Conexibacter sp.]|nr:type I-U CRISPR-associated protein Csb2 [Conexibacter sp.]